MKNEDTVGDLIAGWLNGKVIDFAGVEESG